LKPIRVSVDVDRPREEVFGFLDVLANHEAFTDHMLVDWEYDGPAAGVGARARMRATAPGRADPIEMVVVAATESARIVEESATPDGRRRTRGTYTLDTLPGGGTRVRFELRFVDTLWTDRLAAPLLRGWLKSANATAMRRLGATLGASAPVVAGAPAPARPR
jgi:hypothetical protein